MAAIDTKGPTALTVASSAEQAIKDFGPGKRPARFVGPGKRPARFAGPGKRPARFVVVLVVMVVMSVLAGACGGGASGGLVSVDAERLTPEPAAAPPVAEATAAFAFDLYKEFVGDRDGNLVFSPHSISLALAMTRAGAEGETAAAMDRVLHSESVDELHTGLNALDTSLVALGGTEERLDGTTAELEVNIANSLWGQSGLTFEQAFLETLAENYGAGMRVVDYAADAEGARNEINAWVADETADRITDLIPAGALGALTSLVLANAVYLLAPWEFPFDKDRTEPHPFTRLDGSVTDTDLMGMNESLPYARIGDVQAVELPYVGRDLAMLVIVPDPGRFAEVEASFDEQFLLAVVEALEATEVGLGLPSFRFRTQTSVAPALRTLGMTIAFDPETADFSGMTMDRDLYVSDVIHEAFIAVDEDGTEAAAATAVVMEATSAPAEPVELIVDRPFLFAIRDRQTNAILFLGRITDPTA